MAAGIFAIKLFGFAFLVHLVWWRVRLPKNQTRALLALFVCAWILGWVYTQDSPTPELVRSALLYFGLVVFYVTNYSALEHASPTLTIMGALGDAGERGLSYQEIMNQLAKSPSLGKRLEQLISGGSVSLSDGRYRLVSNGFAAWQLVSLYRKQILGRANGG